MPTYWFWPNCPEMTFKQQEKFFLWKISLSFTRWYVIFADKLSTNYVKYWIVHTCISFLLHIWSMIESFIVCNLWCGNWYILNHIAYSFRFILIDGSLFWLASVVVEAAHSKMHHWVYEVIVSVHHSFCGVELTPYLFLLLSLCY
jgi:hypothetical protein